MTGNNNYEKTTRTRPRFGLEEFTERTKRRTRDLDLESLDHEELISIIYMFADDLELIVAHHESNLRMSDRDIDDIKSSLYELEL